MKGWGVVESLKKVQASVIRPYLPNVFRKQDQFAKAQVIFLAAQLV